MVSYPRQNSNFSFEIHFYKFDIQVIVLCIYNLKKLTRRLSGSPLSKWSGIQYILEIIHSVLNVVNRLVESGDGSMDFQVLAIRLFTAIYTCWFKVPITLVGPSWI
jgi:hypothetical protein